MKLKVIRAVRDAVNVDLEFARKKVPDATLNDLCYASMMYYTSSSISEDIPYDHKILPFEISKILLNTNHCTNMEVDEMETNFIVNLIKKDQDIKKYDNDVIVNGILLMISVFKSIDATEVVVT